jgi:hypothetical protein
MHYISKTIFCPTSNDFGYTSEEVLNGLDAQVKTFINTQAVECRLT